MGRSVVAMIIACHPEPRRRRGTSQSDGNSHNLRFAQLEAIVPNLSKIICVILERL